MKALETTTESTYWNWAGADAAYSKAFAGRGLDVTGPGAAAAAERIGRSAVKGRVVTALDAWAVVRRRAQLDGWQQLLEAAGRADDPGEEARRRLREAAARQDPGRLRALADDPGLADWPAADAVLLAQALGYAKEREAEVRVLRAARVRHGGDFWINAHLGDLLGSASAASREEALGFWRAAVAARPDAAVAHNDLGVLLAGLKRPEEAEKEYREAIRLKPDLPLFHDGLGELLDAQGKPAEAEQEYREALRLKPNYPEAHCNFGALLAKQGKASEAENEYREAIRLKPDLSQAHYNLGNLLSKQGKPAEAEREYREALRLKSDSSQAHTDLGALLAGQNKSAEAEAEYREAIRIKPDYPNAHTDLGALLAGQNKSAEAEAEYREALRHNPNDPYAHNGLGNVLKNQGMAAESEREYHTALLLKPDFPAAHYNFGILLYDQGRAAGAEKEYREALRLKPDWPEARCNLGYVLRDQGHFREALDELRRGHELGSRTPNWRYPSGQWVKECERLVELDALLPCLLAGAADPADAVAALGFIRVCYCTRRHAAAARLSATVMDADPEAANDPRTAIRYNAACSAALAGCGQGIDAPAGEAKRARLRGQALEWLRADLTAWGTLARSGDAKVVQAVQGTLRHWREDSDLAGVRDAGALDQLPEAERAEWRKLWADVDALLQKASPEKK
jgi:tetratricopeptide (TPR) repeat protein